MKPITTGGGPDKADVGGVAHTAQSFRSLLADYSAEVTAPDRKSLDRAARTMPRNSRVYVASLASHDAERQVRICADIHEQGLEPVPHVVARNIEGYEALDDLLGRLSREAGVDRALVLGGDRETPAGDLTDSLQIIESGLLQKHGIGKIAIACYPEGHPRINSDVLSQALVNKVATARAAGLELILISQVCFEAQPIVEMIKTLRENGIHERIRVGVAGPAKPSTLLKYAMICGVGPSLRIVKERQSMMKNLLHGVTPETLITELADAMTEEPDLDIWGIHFFTFASLKNTLDWIERKRAGA